MPFRPPGSAHGEALQSSYSLWQKLLTLNMPWMPVLPGLGPLGNAAPWAWGVKGAGGRCWGSWTSDCLRAALGAQKSTPHGRETVALLEMPPLSFHLLCGCCCRRGVLPRFSFLALGDCSSRAPLCSVLPAPVGSPGLRLKPAQPYAMVPLPAFASPPAPALGHSLAASKPGAEHPVLPQGL